MTLHSRVVGADVSRLIHARNVMTLDVPTLHVYSKGCLWLSLSHVPCLTLTVALFVRAFFSNVSDYIPVFALGNQDMSQPGFLTEDPACSISHG